MKLQAKTIYTWPALAWVARADAESGQVFVRHGPRVETTPACAMEAVWAGEFAAGDLDETDLVFGTGLRVREDRIVFVSSGTVFDRLWHCQQDGALFVSNSLPAVLAVTRRRLLDGYADYTKHVRAIIRGLDEGSKAIPTDGGDIHMTYYRNLVWTGDRLEAVDKPDAVPSFETFEDYREFLRRTAEALGKNMSDPQRQHAVTPMTSISSGYDSCMAAVVSRDAGCNQAATIRKATSLWRGSDSGEHVAEILGLKCTVYERTTETYPDEVALWAGEGRAGIINWTQFEFPRPLCLLFTGCHGEKMWDRVSHDHPDPFVRRDTSSLGFCEFRLHAGVFQCVVPFWGVRHSHELHRITAEEMQPWFFGKDAYDKPIARRIVEEAGVPRDTFGTVNKNTSLESRFLWPYSPDAQASFAKYLAEYSVEDFTPERASRLRIRAKLEELVYYNVLKRLRMRRRTMPWDRLRLESWPFRWANDVLREQYAAGLRDAGVEVGR